jgi:hypothetical protein
VPSRGARISIPVAVRLNLAREAVRRIGAALAAAGRLAGQGLRRGISLWTKTFGSLLRSRYGPWVLLGELLVLAAAMVVLWLSWQNAPSDPFNLVWAFIQALPLALLAVYLLPALAFVAGAVMWEMGKVLAGRARGEGRDGGSHVGS